MWRNVSKGKGGLQRGPDGDKNVQLFVCQLSMSALNGRMAIQRSASGTEQESCCCCCSLAVEHAVIEPLAAPHRVAVVELQEVHAAARIRVRAAVHLLVRVAPVHRNDLVQRAP